MSSHTNFEITFWGVRGSVPTPAQHTYKYGGNTPCLEVRAGNNLLLIDAGTGICRFTERLADGPKRPGFTLRSCLEAAMTPPNFPVPFEMLAGVKEVNEIEPGGSIEIDGVTISTAELNHPDGSIGFRIEHAGKSLAYCLDHEHEEHDQIHRGLAKLAQDADVLIFDAAYSDEDYPRFKGWGHSTWQVGYKTARQLDVKTLVLSGFNPDLTDNALDEITHATKDMTGNTVVAKEGDSLTL